MAREPSYLGAPMNRAPLPTEPKIYPYLSQQEEDPKQFYVHRMIEDTTSPTGAKSSYLHADGVWRTTIHCNNKPTGLFASEAEAKTAINQAT